MVGMLTARPEEDFITLSVLAKNDVIGMKYDAICQKDQFKLVVFYLSKY